MVEPKVTAAVIASAIVPLVMLLSVLFDWGLVEQDVLTAVMGVATVLIPAVTFFGGYFKGSRTSAVSDEFSPAKAAKLEAERARS